MCSSDLVERIVKRVVLDEVSIDKIVAITFTNAAAAEMKKKLTKRIIEINQKQPSSYLKQQQYLISTADISTIHSFCLKIIKNYYYAIKLDPVLASNIFDDLELSLIKEKAFRKLYEKTILKDPKKYQDLFNSLSNRPLDIKTLQETINELANTAILEINPQAWLNDSLKDYSVKSSFKELTNETQKAWWDYLKFQITLLKEPINTIYKYLGQDINYEEDDYYKKHQYYFNQLNEACELGDYNKFQLELKNISQIEKINSFNDDINSRDQYNKQLKLLWSNLFSEKTIIEDLKTQQKIIIQLVDLTIKYLDYFKELKLEAKGVDYNDLERFAYQILIANNNEVAKQLQKQYLEILVDEFQDTNYLQNSIIELISLNNNIFRVGDIKQAIYRFRGGKPQIMQELIKKGEKDDNYKIVYLKENFRSQSKIIEFTNEVFKELMNLDYYNNEYLNNDEVTAGLNEIGPPVLFQYLNYDKEIKMSSNVAKAELIASEIIKLVNDGKKYSEIVVLLRGHSQKKELKKAFDNNNIPSHILLKDGFSEAPGILTVMALLKYLINPLEEISLVAVLKNLFNLSNEELALLKINKEKESYHEYLTKINHPVIEAINKLRKFNPYHLTNLLNEIYQINNYYEKKCDKEQQTNLDVLYEKAVLYQKQNVHLHSFYNLLLSLETSDISEGSTIGIDDNVVRVMTIHQAKGLDFPIVFFWSTSRGNTRTFKTPLAISERLGFGLKTTLLPTYHQRFNLKYELISFNNKIDDLAEEIRILYVALTRAENQLIIVDASPYKLPLGTLLATDIFLNPVYTYWLYLMATEKTQSFYNLIVTDSYFLVPEKLIDSIDSIVNVTFKYKKPISKAQIITPSDSEDFINNELNFKTDRFGFGTKMHELIEKLPHQGFDEEALLKYEGALTKLEIEKLLLLFNSPFYHDLLNYQVDKELPFVYKDKDNNIINGIIDFVAWKDNEIIIIDFKTDNVSNANILIKRYEKQLLYYKEALSTIYPTNIISTFIYSFALNTFIEIKTSTS